MAINTNVPLASQTLADTQNPIRQNFIDINRAFSVNHGEYNGANEGKHTFIQFPLQATTPVFAANEFGLWNENNVAPNPVVPQLWVNNPSNLATTQIPMCASTLDSNAAPIPADNIFTYLPSSFIIQAGSFSKTTGGGAGTATITFPKQFPNRCITAIAVLTSPSANVFVVGSQNPTQTNFQIIAKTSANGIPANDSALDGSYIAIGY